MTGSFPTVSIDTPHSCCCLFAFLHIHCHMHLCLICLHNIFHLRYCLYINTEAHAAAVNACMCICLCLCASRHGLSVDHRSPSCTLCHGTSVDHRPSHCTLCCCYCSLYMTCCSRLPNLTDGACHSFLSTGWTHLRPFTSSSKVNPMLVEYVSVL